MILILKRVRKVLRMKKAASTSQNAYIIGEEDSDEDNKDEKEGAGDLESQLPTELASQAPTDKGLRQNNTDMILDADPSHDEEDADLGQLGKPAFATMCQPTTIQVGHFMYLRCGHNGNFLTIERKAFERHLHRAGCLSVAQLGRNNSDMTLSFVLPSARSIDAASEQVSRADNGDILGGTLDLRPSLFR